MLVHLQRRGKTGTTITVEPRFNEGPGGWQNMFTITRFRCIEVLSHIFYYHWDQEIHLLY